MILKTWITYYGVDTSGQVTTIANEDLQNHILSINAKRSSDSKNNSLEIELDNPIVAVNSDGSMRRKFITEAGDILFKATEKDAGHSVFEERIEVYQKHVTDLTEDIVSDENLIFSGQIHEVELIHENAKSHIRLTCSDRTFNILNRIYSNYYTGLNSPEIIQEVIRQVNEDASGRRFNTSGELGNGDAYKYLIDARLFSEGTKGSVDTDAVAATSSRTITSGTATFVSDGVAIGDIVKNETTNKVALVREVISETSLKISKPIFDTAGNITISDGFIIDFRPDGTPFPDITFGYGKKPTYEWISTVSQTELTNSQDELDPDSTTAIVCGRPYIFYLDGKNRAHWFYPDNTESVEMRVGASGPIGTDINEYRVYNNKLKKGIFDIVNFIEFDAGVDMNGNNIGFYAQDTSAGGPIVKDSYRPYVTIAQKMKVQDLRAGNITRNNDESYNYPSSYPMNPAWNPDISVSNDIEYNDEFRSRARQLGVSRAMSEILQTANPRFNGKIETRGFNFYPSDLMKFTDREMGISNLLLRMSDIQHNVNKNGWFTTISVREDVPEVTK